MAKSLREKLQKKEPKQAKKIVAVRMPEDMEKELSRIAKKNSESVSQVILRALRLALGMDEKGVR